MSDNEQYCYNDQCELHDPNAGYDNCIYDGAMGMDCTERVEAPRPEDFLGSGGFTGCAEILAKSDEEILYWAKKEYGNKLPQKLELMRATIDWLIKENKS